MKRLFSIILTVAMLAGAIAIFPAAAEGSLPFKDVKESDWFYPYVSYVYENGLMKGTSGTAFSPDETLDRAMFITIIGRLVGAESNDPSPFKDTEADSWYSPYVAWAANLGIVKGFPDGTFRPYDAITREQMAAATDRFLLATGLNTVAGGGIFDFADEAKVSDWAVESVGNLKKIGIFTGDNKGRFNPEANTTRAEAATVIMRLKNAIDSAWQGYVPADGAGCLVFGAKYLFENGSLLAGGMKRGLDETGDLPVLTSVMDATSAKNTYLSPNSVGVSISYAEFRAEDYPFVKICCGYQGADEGSLRAVFNVNLTSTEIPLTAGEDEDGMMTATADLTEILAAQSIDYQTQLVNMLFSPYEKEYSGDGEFLIRYIGFFKTEADADAFGAATDPGISDYLRNYSLGFTADVRDYTAEDKSYFDGLLKNRIAEIKNSPSELTPEKVKARGGTCWYVSSVHGDDRNDGTSPDKPFESLEGLVKKRYMGSDGEVVLYKPKTGDGVFFERGSVFYPKKYHNHSMSNLTCQEGVDYGAYGEGPKPVFTCSLDFSEYGNTGNWQPTEYENIWVIDKIDTTVRVNDDGSEDETYWWGENSEITNIYFNGGEGVGLRIVADSADSSAQTFAPGRKTAYRGLWFNGYEYVFADERTLDNPGTALKNNLEFFHDYATGSLYLYFDKGNPSDWFDDIKASRWGTAVWGADNSVIDNLAFLYAGNTALTMGKKNVTITNCEVGCVHGDLGSMESGIGYCGESDGIVLRNNYVHDVGDGGMTNQNVGQDPEKPIQIKNVAYLDNVTVSCGHSAEIWNHLVNIDENGVSASRIENVLIKGNMFAYCAYTSRQKEATGSFSNGECICGSVYGEYSNCRIEDNIFLYGVGSIFCAYMATYRQPRGWEALGNLYVADPDSYRIGYCFETLNHIDHGMLKRARVFFPYTEEGLSWYASLGIDPKGVFYRYTTENPHEFTDGTGFYFMTGYYAERGEDPTAKYLK